MQINKQEEIKILCPFCGKEMINASNNIPFYFKNIAKVMFICSCEKVIVIAEGK